jgi:hypothetical protein
MRIALLMSIVIVSGSCNSPVRKQKNSEDDMPRVVQIDSVFNNYFMPRGEGYTGGDGTYSVELPDGRTVWIWGDTFIGNVTADNRRIKTNPLYIRNCFTIIQEDGSLDTFQQGESSEWKSMMIPPEVTDGASGLSEHELWYWPGDGFVENGRLKVFLSKFSQEEKGMWGFKFQSTELFEFSLPNFEIMGTSKFENLNGIHFGHAICQTDDYTYIYGLKDKLPFVARTKAGDITGQWEFLAEAIWQNDVSKATPMVDLKGSEQFSVFKSGETYIMIMQTDELSGKIYSYTSETPYGPWVTRKMIYEALPLDGCDKCWTYNALAHPQYTKDNMLLISYNTNSMEMQDHYENALIYRPRFIRVPLEMILE